MNHAAFARYNYYTGTVSVYCLECKMRDCFAYSEVLSPHPMCRHNVAKDGSITDLCHRQDVCAEAMSAYQKGMSSASQ